MFFLRSVLINVFTTAVFFLLFISMAFFYRAEIFEFFGSQYLEGLESDLITSKDLDSRFLKTDHEKKIIESVKAADPAVVSIVSSPPESGERSLFPEGVMFDRFPEPEEMVGGSGFIVSGNGFVVTNRHVVEDDGVDYIVLTNDGERYEAEVLDKDTFFDIAILKIDSEKDFEYLEFGDSSAISVGQTAIAIGNALGEFENSVSVGVVSGLSRSITAGGSRGNIVFFDEVIQTDAAINPGNSGGPLMSIDGKVIGVNSALAMGSQNIGFAVPSNIVEPIVASVKETGRIIRPFLGIRYVDINSSLQRQKDLPVDYGILLVKGGSGEPAVSPGTPAEEAGLKEGDIIIEVDGEKVEGRRDFARKIRYKKVGEIMRMKVLRDGEEILTEATLVEAPGGI